MGRHCRQVHSADMSDMLKAGNDPRTVDKAVFEGRNEGAYLRHMVQRPFGGYRGDRSRGQEERLLVEQGR